MPGRPRRASPLRLWRTERAMLATWPRRLQAQYLDALTRFDPPIPPAERRRLYAVVQPPGS